MSKKQIDEIAKLICAYPQCIHYNIIGACANTECQTVDIAEHLYNADYRKSTDVAEEIFAEIEGLMLDGAIGGKYPAKVINPDKYAELKKKYTGVKK